MGAESGRGGMRPISPRVRAVIDSDPYYRRCARSHHRGCSGRLTMEHALRFAGRQVDEVWAIIPLCWRHHLGDLLDKRLNELIALSRATDDDLNKYPKAKARWVQMRTHLEGVYGKIKAK